MMITMYEKALEIIKTYTGLSPTSFLLILTLFLITYSFVSSFFVHVDPDASKSKSTPADPDVAKSTAAEVVRQLEHDMKREPVQVGPITPEQLKSYDGSDPNKPLLMAIKGQIYDVSRGRMFYGPGGSYSLFAGRDATRALALMSFDPQDLTSNLEGLSEADLDVLSDWELKFSEKYPKVGTLVADEEQEQPELKHREIEAAEDKQDLESKKVV